MPINSTMLIRIQISKLLKSSLFSFLIRYNIPHKSSVVKGYSEKVIHIETQSQVRGHPQATPPFSKLRLLYPLCSGQGGLFYISRAFVKIGKIKDLHLKVVFQELQEFDDELSLHSDIENNILFPKALKLEKKVSKILENYYFSYQ